MKVIIAGSRTFRDYELLKSKCDHILKNSNVEEIVSGGQVSILKRTNKKYGADYFGEQYAKQNNIPIKRFPADWEKWDLSAGPIRNEQMAQYADALIVFWDGWSKGTASMIDKATKHKLLVRVIKFDPKSQTKITIPDLETQSI